MSISVTSAAAKHFISILRKYPDALGIRLGIKPSGCAEYKYTIDIAKTIDSEDETLEIEGVKVVINKTSLEKIHDTEVDYINQGLNSMVVFRNPHAVHECGCGESFSLK